MKLISITGTDRDVAGLTLLEVLAATMIFALVMTVLIGTSSTAVHHVGVSARRLEASLLADNILADLEIQMKQGIAPEIDESETTHDQYSIRILRSDLAQDSGMTNSDGAEPSAAAMFGAGLPEVAKHLKQYDIEVSWFERNGPQSVTRTTFAFDWELAAVEFSDLFQQRSGGGFGGGGDDSSNGRNGDEKDPNSDLKELLRLENKNRNQTRVHGHNARLEALRRNSQILEPGRGVDSL